MTLTVSTDERAVRIDPYGAVRVSDSQVLLDLVVAEFRRGANASQIAASYPTISIAEVQAALAYYQQHQEKVEEYLRIRRETAEALRAKVESSTVGLKARLLARQQVNDHDCPGG
jgi:uncharacterized protein (DUF433 family)